MTSIPSHIDALRSLLPMLGREGGPGHPHGPGGPEGLELDDGRPPRPHDGDWRGDSPQMRSGGSTPLPQVDADQLMDAVSTAIRHNPSHPLARELAQLAPETLRQLVQFVAQYSSVVGDVPAQASEHLHHAAARAASANEDAQHFVPTEIRGRGEAMRAAAQAQAQQAGGERPMAATGREAPSASTGRGTGEDLRMAALSQASDARASADARAAASSHSAEAAALLSRFGAALAAPAARDGLPATATPPGQAGATASPLELAAQQALLARTPTEALLPGRPDGALAAAAADPASGSGLLGLAGAAGVTLAAVGNPAGTTHANAPQSSVRTRKSDEARQERDEQVQQSDRDDADGGSSDGRRGSRERNAGAADGEPARKGADDGRARAPASGAAAGHTANAGVVLPFPGHGEGDDDASPAGHTHAGPPAEDARDQDVRDRRLQWLYWSLIVVTYGCLGLALTTFAPGVLNLPIAPDRLPALRNVLTTAGLAAGLWAWLVARRMR